MTEQILEKGFMFLLCTQLTANDCVAGRIYRLSSDEVVPFAGLDQALVMMNRWMDEVDPLTDEAVLRTFKTGRGARSMASVFPAAHSTQGQTARRQQARTAYRALREQTAYCFRGRAAAAMPGAGKHFLSVLSAASITAGRAKSAGKPSGFISEAHWN